MSHCMFIINGRDTKDKRHKNIILFKWIINLH